MSPERKAWIKKWLWRLVWIPILLVLFVVILEIFYRNQWIDMYKRELHALNPGNPPQNPSKKLLVLGDSFSATPDGWVEKLRKSHPDYQITNSSVPGTTIFQANLMLSHRLAAYQPDLIIYQVYVGNDLFDLRYPINWSEIGFGRNLYWWLANKIPSLGWLNYALGQLKRQAALPDFQQGKVDGGEFDPQKYSERERLYLTAEPNLIENQVLLRGGREKDMERYLELFQAFLATAKEAHCPVLVLVIPHCAQVKKRYAERMTMIGAKGMDEAGLNNTEYAFWRKLVALKADGVRFVNVLEPIRERENAGEAMYFLHDAHLNAAGQALVAHVVDSVIATE